MSNDDDVTTDEVEHEACVVEHEDPEGTDETWSPFDAEYEDVQLPVCQKVMGTDGLPHVHAPVQDGSDIPELSETTLVCMGIYTSFVIRDEWRDVVVTFTPEQVDRAPNGKWRTRVSTVRWAVPHDHPLLHGIWGLPDQAWVEVEPIRPPCVHYIRQKSHFEHNPAYKDQYRLCALRRTTEGAMMSVKDRGMWACDGRTPRDPVSEETLDAFDRMKAEQGKKRVFLNIFNLDAAQLEKDQTDATGTGDGVLGGTSTGEPA